MARGKLESWKRAQLENRLASWKLDKLEISGRAHELESWKLFRSC